MPKMNNTIDRMEDDLQQKYSYMKQVANMMMLESESETYEQLVQRFFHYMQGTLEYYLCIYKDEAFEGEMEMLPPEAKAAVWLNQMFSREEDDWDGKLADLKKCVTCYPKLRNNVKQLVRFIGEIKQEAATQSVNWELLQMVELMKDKIRLLAAQGLKQEAITIASQVRALAPKDRELIRLQEELNGELEHRQILLTISILCSGRSKTTIKCLESLEELRSRIPLELIIVDTGCDEKLHSHLANYADVITRFTWCDDFAKARNAGLTLARGEWFLYLDDDEWFIDTEELVEFFTSGKYKHYAAARYIQRNYLDMAEIQYTDSWVMRMIRLDKDTHFRSRIHELLTPIKGETASLHSVVKHFGYVYETEEALWAHYERNSFLLKEMIKEEPHELRWYMLLAQEYRTAEQWQELYDLGAEGRALVDNMLAADHIASKSSANKTVGRNNGGITKTESMCAVDSGIQLALGTFYGAQVWALKEQGKKVLIVENGMQKVQCVQEIYVRSMELCREILADKRNMELTQAFSELHMCWFAYWLGNYEEAIAHGLNHLEWKHYFVDKETPLIQQRIAPFVADTFDIVMEKQTCSILICADLRMGCTVMLEKYLDSLGWQERQIYVFEDMIPTLAKVMDWLKDTEAGKKLIEVMQGHEALWQYYQSCIL